MSNVVSLSDKKEKNVEEKSEATTDSTNAWFEENMKKNKEKEERRKQEIANQKVRAIINRTRRNP